MRPEKVTINVKTNTYFYLVLLLLLMPLKWLGAWLLAICVHEFCHWAAVKLCGGEVYTLTVGVGGTEMVCSPLSDRRRLLAVLSGPAGGFALILLGRWMPRTALCSWLLSVYNLLPIYPLDGGNALEILLKGRANFSVVQRTICIILTLVAIYVSTILDFGILPLAIIGGLWLKNRKSPCQQSVCKVQ